MYEKNAHFAARIRELRKAWGLTQQEMADMVMLRKTTISNYESGYATPTISTLKVLMEKFNLPASYFIPDIGDVATSKKAQLLYGTAMPYYDPNNIKGLMSCEMALMDSCLTLPAQIHIPKRGYISTSAIDNSMNLCGIKKGSCVIINTERKEPNNGEIFAAIRNNTLIIRKYHITPDSPYMTSESTRIPTGLSIEEIPKENFCILGILNRVITQF